MLGFCTDATPGDDLLAIGIRHFLRVALDHFHRLRAAIVAEQEEVMVDAAVPPRPTLSQAVRGALVE
ncbi:MAG TPA: hypothetical protein VMF62_08510, partial [Acetobacteraceae bacterium]|nr:hypothetical protein [Acetobacteraceae bacterium]